MASFRAAPRPSLWDEVSSRVAGHFVESANSRTGRDLEERHAVRFCMRRNKVPTIEELDARNERICRVGFGSAP